jgi:acetoin utilization deacetylase AcuC-like enzyme
VVSVDFGGGSKLVPAVLRRRWRALRLAWRPPAVRVVYHRRYSAEIPVPAIDVDRARKVLSFLGGEKLLRRSTVLRPRRIGLGDLRRVHDDDYLERLETPEGMVPVYGEAVGPEFIDDLLAAHRAMVGGTVLAARSAAQDGGVVLNLGGGFHHARRDRGAGFCAFNDVAVAVDRLRARGFAGRILVIDLDLHDGDGTRRIFAEDASVHTWSLHNQDLDDAPATASTSIALGGGVGDDAYLQALRESLPYTVDEVRPALVFYLAGCDPALDDRLGDWNITAPALLRRDVFVMELLRDLAGSPPTVILPAGGYGQGAWRYTARFASWLLTGGEVIEPSGRAAHALAHYRRVARLLGHLEPEERDGPDWSLGPEDLPGGLAPPPRRFLDRFSHHAVELAVERYGLLEGLRRRGFGGLRLDFDLDNPAGQTLRVVCDEGGETAPLVEVRVSRDRESLAPMELLRIEWLSIQNPRARFTADRPALPGQKRPGLGLLRDVVALLTVTCFPLELDGVICVPSHYHVAVQSERLFRFLDAGAEARFRAVEEALAGRSLVESVRLIEAGRVVDAEGRPYRYEPLPMVLPVSARLRSHLRRRRTRGRAEPVYRVIDAPADASAAPGHGGAVRR